MSNKHEQNSRKKSRKNYDLCPLSSADSSRCSINATITVRAQTFLISDLLPDLAVWTFEAFACSYPQPLSIPLMSLALTAVSHLPVAWRRDQTQSLVDAEAALEPYRPQHSLTFCFVVTVTLEHTSAGVRLLFIKGFLWESVCNVCALGNDQLEMNLFVCFFFGRKGQIDADKSIIISFLPTHKILVRHFY